MSRDAHDLRHRCRMPSGLRRAAVAALLAAGGLCSALPAAAMSFAEVVAAARANDAQYRAAGHDLQAAQLGVPIARSALLPSANMTFSRSEVSGSRQFYNSQNQEVKVQVDYASPQSALNLRLPLWNQEARARYDQAQVQAESAASIYRSRGLELIDRTGTTYLQVLLAHDARTLAETQLVALKGQLTRSEQRFKRGEGTRTEQALAQAAMDVARVRLLEAEEAIELSRRNLKRLTGRDTPPLNQLPADFIPTPVVPDRLGEWLELAERNSPTLQARQQQLLAAKFGVKRQQAGHMPRVDLVASISRNENESLTNLGQTSVLKSMGVQVNVPLYSGGGVDASVKQALADQARVEEEVRVEREAMQFELQRNFQLVASGPEKIKAYFEAVESNAVAYKGSVRAQEAGLATTADVLDAQARLYSAQRDLAQARYDYLQARLRLMAFAGQPMEEIVSEVDRHLSVAPAAKQ